MSFGGNGERSRSSRSHIHTQIYVAFELVALIFPRREVPHDLFGTKFNEEGNEQQTADEWWWKDGCRVKGKKAAEFIVHSIGLHRIRWKNEREEKQSAEEEKWRISVWFLWCWKHSNNTFQRGFESNTFYLLRTHGTKEESHRYASTTQWIQLPV